MRNIKNSEAFSLIEILIVITIIGILSSIIFGHVSRAQEAAFYTRAKRELSSIRESLEMYRMNNNGQFPPDTSRNIPPGLEEYLAPGIWPDASWPGSVFDWDNWTDPDSGENIYQISIRFCPVGEPSECNFPNRDWAEDFDINSSVFYCIDGPCRSHIASPANHPGYCVNCSEPEYPYGIY